MAKKPQARPRDTSPKRRPGPKRRVFDVALFKSREALRGAFDDVYCDVGTGWGQIQQRADAPRILQPLALYANHHYVIKLLITELDEEPLQRVRALIGNPYNAQRIATILAKLRSELNHLRVIPSGETFASWTREQEEERKKKLAEQGKQAAEKSELLRVCEVFFAQEELARFCRSRRYEISSSNLANAFAAMPNTGWRQSMKLCLALQKQEGVQPSMDLQFATYKLVRSLVSYIDQRLDRDAGIERVEKLTSSWLHTAHFRSANRLTDLRHNRDQLLAAVRIGYGSQYSLKEHPFVITREFLRFVREQPRS